MNNNYIIDFERLNQLTTHNNDSPNNSTLGPSYMYGITRKILKEYMDIYVGYDPSKTYKAGNRVTTVSLEQYLNIVETLKHNRILITPADIRDKKINQVLDIPNDEDDDLPF